MKKIYGKLLYTVSILGMLLMLTISIGMLVSSTPKSLQNQDASPIILYTTAENNVLHWNTTWGGAESDCSYGVVRDASGNLYCIGDTESFGAGNSDFALVKFASTGTKLWNTTWGGVSADGGWSIVIDASGSLYCFGWTASFGAGSYDFALVKFASNGIKLWNTTWGGASADLGNGMAMDASGFLYCTGYTYSFGVGGYDVALVKFAPNGTQLWNTTWGGSVNDYGEAVAVDAAGNLYCVGSTNSFGAGNSDLALVKFDLNGTKQWNTTWGGAGYDHGSGIMVDASGSSYCVGDTESFGAGGIDLALVKFDLNGTRFWNITWGGVGADFGSGIAREPDGCLFATGYTNSFGAGNYDFALVKFDQNNTQIWNTTWGGAGTDQGIGIMVDASGLVYCVGYTESFGLGLYDLALVKFGYQPGATGIPGFEFAYLLIGLLAFIPLGLRKRFH